MAIQERLPQPKFKEPSKVGQNFSWQKVAEKLDNAIPRLEATGNRVTESSVVEKKLEADDTGVTIFKTLLIHQVIPHIKPEHPQGFEERFMEIMKDPDVIPILISNHQGWADVITMGLEAEKLTRLINKARGFDDDRFFHAVKDDLITGFSGRMLQKKEWGKKRFKGFVLTIAKSLETDSKNQGAFLKKLTKQARPWLHKHFLTMDGFVRTKDVKKYELLKSDNEAYSLRMRQNIEEGITGLAFFPEASVESGRFADENGNLEEIKGMQRFDKKFQANAILNDIKKAGKKAVFIVMGSHGAFRIIDPNSKNPKTEEKVPVPTWKVWRHNLNPLNTYIVSDFIKMSLEIAADIKVKGLMEVKVGMPILAEDMRKEIMENPQRDPALSGKSPRSEETEIYLGKKISPLLPKEAQGVFA